MRVKLAVVTRREIVNGSTMVIMHEDFLTFNLVVF